MNLEYIGATDISDNDVAMNIPYSTDHSLLLIEYGQKNNVQAWGGGTLVIPKILSKPCSIKVYNPNDTDLGLIYIYNDVSNNKIIASKKNASAIFRVNVYAYG